MKSLSKPPEPGNHIARDLAICHMIGFVMSFIAIVAICVILEAVTMKKEIIQVLKEVL